MNIKAFTVYNPWARLIAIGAKEYETRGKNSPVCRHLGVVAIHAGMTRDFLEICSDEPFYTGLGKGVMHFGKIIALAYVSEVHPAHCLVPQLSASELAFGDFREGRMAIKCTHVEPLKEPIAVRGQQGLWEWDAPESLVAAYRRKLEAAGVRWRE